MGVAAVGLAVLVVVITSAGGSSGGVANHRLAVARPAHVAKAAKVHKSPVVAARTSKPASKPSAPIKVAGQASGIPQQNGGDGDPDNNGAPSDGDGNL
jgi:hypothetical protein